MPYNTKLADRIREALVNQTVVEEKEMFRGICFMVDGKMCVCVSGEEMLCRIGAEAAEIALENNDARQMINNGSVMKDYIYISEGGYRTQKDFDNWVQLALAFNPKAKAAKKKK